MTVNDDVIMLTCPRCGYTWDVRLSGIKETERIAYRGTAEERTYRLLCPNCGSFAVFTVEIKELSDD